MSTDVPTQTPIKNTTLAPTYISTDVPTHVHSYTETPTKTPTKAFTETPTKTPTEALTETPTKTPTEALTETPTKTPTEVLTETPTKTPTEVLTETPTFSVHYSDDSFLNINIILEDDKWEDLRRTERDLTSQWFSCNHAFDNPYLWYEANIDIDNVLQLDSVGVRKKGFYGSRSKIIPSLKIDTDKFIDDQEFEDGTEHITLNNNKQDESRSFTCLAYDIFRDARYPAPRCNMAKVSINGRKLDTTFSHVEPIKKNFLKLNFESHAGNLYEGTLTDFVTDWLPKGEETRWEVKMGEDEDVKMAPLLHNIGEILENTADKNLDEHLFQFVNKTMFFRFWALEIICGLKYGYTANQNNFYVYTDNDKLVFIPWGADRYADDMSIDKFIYAEIPRRLSRIPSMRRLLITTLDDIIHNQFHATSLWKRVELRIKNLPFSSNEMSAQHKLQKWLYSRKEYIRQIIEDGDNFAEGSESTPTCQSVQTIREIIIISTISIIFIGIIVSAVCILYCKKTNNYMAL
jgi:hypothetical protein